MRFYVVDCYFSNFVSLNILGLNTILTNFLSKQYSIAIIITSQMTLTEGDRELLLGCAMTVSDT